MVSSEARIEENMGRSKRSEVKDSVIRFKDQNGIAKMNITKDVKKKVTNPVSGAKVERVAHVTITVPDYTVTESKDGDKVVKTIAGLTIANAIAVFGSTEKLIQYAIAGLWSHVRTTESNALGQADKASRQLGKAAKALKQVMPSLTDEALRAMLMSNPEYAKTFESQTFELEVSKTINIADFDAPILDPATGADETADEDEETEVAPVA